MEVVLETRKSDWMWVGGWWVDSGRSGKGWEVGNIVRG